MNQEIWMWGLALPSLMGLTWVVTRWWYLRRVRAVQNKLLAVERAYQSTLKLMAQTRRQVEDLKSVVAAYQSRLSTADRVRRPRQVEVDQPEAEQPEAQDDEVVDTRRGPPVVWADTQPL